MSPELWERCMLSLDIGPVGIGSDVPAQASLAHVPALFGQSSSCSMFSWEHTGANPKSHCPPSLLASLLESIRGKISQIRIISCNCYCVWPVWQQSEIPSQKALCTSGLTLSWEHSSCFLDSRISSFFQEWLIGQKTFCFSRWQRVRLKFYQSCCSAGLHCTKIIVSGLA